MMSAGLSSGGLADAPVLAGEKVSVRFGGIQAVDGVDLELRPGKVHSVIGPNGAGKTTLFDALSGVTRPTSGRVLLRGDDVTAASVTARARRGLRRTFQRQQTFGWLSVEDNMMVALDWKGGGGGFIGDLLHLPARTSCEARRRERVKEILGLCGISRTGNAPIGSLSIGEARLVEIGRSIVDEPAVLLLDEPTSGLHDAEVDRVGKLLRQLLADSNCAVGLVEHDMRFVMDISDEITVLNLGSVIAHGTPEAIQRDPAVASAYLGV